MLVAYTLVCTENNFKDYISAFTMREKCPNTTFFGPYFPVFAPGKTPHLDTFHTVFIVLVSL